MKDIVIFEDGKGARGSKAKLIKRGNKRVLIEFIKYNYKENKDELVTEWFKAFIHSSSRDKKTYKYNNKRRCANYCHEETNEFFSDFCQTESFVAEFREYQSNEYADSLYS